MAARGYRGGSYVATDGWVDPPRNVRAYALAMQRAGVDAPGAASRSPGSAAAVAAASRGSRRARGRSRPGTCSSPAARVCTPSPGSPARRRGSATRATRSASPSRARPCTRTRPRWRSTWAPASTGDPRRAASCGGCRTRPRRPARRERIDWDYLRDDARPPAPAGPGHAAARHRRRCGPPRSSTRRTTSRSSGRSSPTRGDELVRGVDRERVRPRHDVGPGRGTDRGRPRHRPPDARRASPERLPDGSVRRATGARRSSTRSRCRSP